MADFFSYDDSAEGRTLSGNICYSCMQKQRKPVSLTVCIVMDLIGYASYSIPGLGELTDIVWAPISALIFYRLFGGWKGAFGGLFNFVEELSPGLDFIPSFTIMWCWQRLSAKRNSMPQPRVVPQRIDNTDWL